MWFPIIAAFWHRFQHLLLAATSRSNWSVKNFFISIVNPLLLRSLF